MKKPDKYKKQFLINRAKKQMRIMPALCRRIRPLKEKQKELG